MREGWQIDNNKYEKSSILKIEECPYNRNINFYNDHDYNKAATLF